MGVCASKVDDYAAREAAANKRLRDKGWKTNLAWNDAGGSLYTYISPSGQTFTSQREHGKIPALIQACAASRKACAAANARATKINPPSKKINTFAGSV